MKRLLARLLAANRLAGATHRTLLQLLHRGNARLEEAFADYLACGDEAALADAMMRATAACRPGYEADGECSPRRPCVCVRARACTRCGKC